MTLIIILCVCVGAVLIWCSLQGERKLLEYVVISPLLLEDWKTQKPSLVVIELRENKNKSPEALFVPLQQLEKLLLWIPPRTTLVFCGKRELELCRLEIEATLLGVGFDVVYLLEEEAGWSSGLTSPELMAHADLDGHA